MLADSESPGPGLEDDRVTIVVASRDRRADLLASLARHRARVLYVDNASTDGSPDAVRAAFPDVDVVELAQNVGAYARTLGVRRARTPFVAFADDDSWWAPGSLAAGADLLEQHADLGLVNARILVGEEERLDPMCAEMAGSPLPRPPGLPGEALLGFVACGAMVRRAAFLDAGGFDDVVRFPGEEERLALDLAERGWAMAYVDELVVHHHPSPRRHGTDARRRAMTRSKILTAVMRLPARETLTIAWKSRADGVARAGVRDAVPRLPAALRRRRLTPRRVLDLRDLLRRHDASASGAAARVAAATEGARR